MSARPARSALPWYTPIHLSPGVAALLSFLVPGFSQAMMGQLAKGLVIFVVAVLLVGGFGLLNLLSALDAAVTARRMELGQELEEWRFF